MPLCKSHATKCVVIIPGKAEMMFLRKPFKYVLKSAIPSLKAAEELSSLQLHHPVFTFKRLLIARNN